MPSYTNLFEVFGVYARAFAQFKNLADRNLNFSSGGETCRTLDRLRSEFVGVMNGDMQERDRLDAVALLTDAARTARGWTSQLDLSLDAWVRNGVADALDIAGATRSDVLAALARQMATDDESVAANAVTVEDVEFATTNVGTCQCYVSGETVDPEEMVADDERIRDQVVTVECVRDAAHHRVAVGGEEFRIVPEEGAAVSALTIPVTYGDTPSYRNVVMDGAFELEDAGEFAWWEAIAGAGVFSRDVTTKLFGAGSLKITGNGATAGDLRQDLANRDPAMPSGRMFALGAWAYVSSLSAGTVTIDLIVDGDPSTLQLVVNGSTTTGQWLHLGGFEYVPRATFPNKVEVRVRCSSDFSGEVFVDGVCLAPATEVPHAGVRVALFEGATAPQALPIADRFTFETTSDDAGAFQSFFRDRLGVALPSAGSPTISDSLAE
ncbi:MAG: hypothetical protein IT462_05790 [Planctomycetes bacterium]|nr:hypothetical protein [Planctomycetota bacterium]